MRLTRIGITFCMFLVMGCGVSNYDQGRTFLKQGQFDAAIAYFKLPILKPQLMKELVLRKPTVNLASLTIGKVGLKRQSITFK